MNAEEQKALDNFAAGCNCCQAVVAAAGGKYGVPEETLMRMGAAFGGGMRRGEVCGAVVGALMILGLRYGAESAGDAESKKTANARTGEFMTEYKKRHGSYLCRELLKSGSGKEACGRYVADAMALLGRFDA